MFDPLPSLVRRRREERNLTLQQLAQLAKVSRNHLIAFEKGENVSLKFVLKVARALGMTSLPIAELVVEPAVPELTVLLAAADAVAAAERVVAATARSLENAATTSGELSDVSRSIGALLQRTLEVQRGHSGLITAAAERLAKSSALSDPGLREIAEKPDALPLRRKRIAAPEKTTTARKRAGR